MFQGLSNAKAEHMLTTLAALMPVILVIASAATQYIHNLPLLDNGTACCRGMYDPKPQRS